MWPKVIAAGMRFFKVSFRENRPYSPIIDTGDIKMEREKLSPSKNHCDIGEVMTLMDKINAARELSPFCWGTEILLTSKKNFYGYSRQQKLKNKS